MNRLLVLMGIVDDDTVVIYTIAVMYMVLMRFGCEILGVVTAMMMDD